MARLKQPPTAKASGSPDAPEEVFYLVGPTPICHDGHRHEAGALVAMTRPQAH